MGFFPLQLWLISTCYKVPAMRKTLLAFASFMLLAACGGASESLSQLRLADPSSDPYQSSLADGYLQFAEQKAAKEEWATAEFFAQKGLAAQQGQEVGPESPASWQVPPATVTTLTDFYEKLNAAIEQNKSTQPALTAAAVVSYDRWLDAIANSQSPEMIDAEGARFASALQKLNQVQVAQPGTQAPVSEPGVTQAGGATIFYFPFDSDQLGSTAKAAIAKLAKSIKPTSNVNINGHADRAGTEAYNQDLSERRAKFVEGALRGAGVPASALHYFAFGESDPAVPTADGVEEPKNRRVEVFVE